MTNGFTLNYDGCQFAPSTTFASLKSTEARPTTGQVSQPGITKTKKLEYCFSQIGALAIRLHNGMSQRINLLAEAIDPQYKIHAVETTAKGDDQADLFEHDWSKLPVCQAQTLRLQKPAFASLGKGKHLNEVGQRQVHHNTEGFRGEQYLWDKIHSSVWHTGINLAGQLSKQGFSYVSCPPNLDPSNHELITEALEAGKYTVTGEPGNEEIIVLGHRLQTYPLLKLYTDKASIEIDPGNTFQNNGLVINASAKGGKAPLGWMLHKGGNKKAVPHTILEETVRVIRLAKGEFHGLTPQHQKLLEVGARNGELLGFTQSPAFNAILDIADYLETNYGFDPEPLIGNSIGVSYKSVNDFFSNSANVEDFLTGLLLTEMVQSLKVTREGSQRKRKIPMRLTCSFAELNNTAKAIAYAYDLKYKEKSLLRVDSVGVDNRFSDIAINGQLALPSFSYGKHSAAILATSVLVSEQILLEQLIREAYVNHGKNGVVDLLMQVPVDEAIALRIAQLAAKAKSDANGPVLGLQFDDCDEMVALLRKTLGFDVLIELTQTLEQEGKLTDEALEEFNKSHSKEELFKAFTTLKGLADYIQRNPSTSAEAEGSRGIAAGLEPLLAKLFPEKFAQKEAFQVPGVTRQQLDEKRAAATSTNSTGSTTANIAAVATSKVLDSFGLDTISSFVKQAAGALAANAPAIPWVVFMAIIAASREPLI